MQRHSGTAAEAARRGLLCGISAYVVWGFFPLYFHALAAIPAAEVVAHRIVWSALFLLLLTGILGRWGELLDVCRSPRLLGILVCSSALITINWLVFIHAVEHRQVLQSSLGYFVTPLVSVLLGFVFLGERMRRLQKISFFLAAVAVLSLGISVGVFPWIALILAVTFGSYGLLRKVAPVSPMTGLAVETFLTAPFALCYLLLLHAKGSGAFLGASTFLSMLLPAAGVITATPLMLFADAAKRLPLMTIGFLQYITPTLHFALAVLAFGESFTGVYLVTFLLIWGALALFSVDAARAARIPR